MKNKVLAIGFIVFFIGIIIWTAGALGYQYLYLQNYNYISNFGLFLTIFGIIIIAIETFIIIWKESKSFQLNTKNILCPKCKRNIPFPANICPYCKSKFIDILTIDKLDEEMKELERKLWTYNKPNICLLCGFKLQGAENFCPDCGYRL